MKRIWWKLLFLGMVALMACNMPTAATPTVSHDTVQTAAAMTVQAALTQAAVAATPALTSQVASPTPATSGVVFTVTPAPTPPPSSTPVPTQDQCNLAHFVRDVTVPDGTTFHPGETFTKTWRLKNVGTCTWQNYALVFDSGNHMGGPSVVPISGSVAPGEEVDISVDLVAPNQEGNYKGFWRLRDDKGVLFGLTTGNAFWVAIKVAKPSTATPTPTPTLVPPALLVLDFYDEAPHAAWYNSNNEQLPFPGSGGDSRGFARYADGYVLEDGHAYSRVLETHPQWIDNGSIIGHYPKVTVPAGAHFRAKIGFIAMPDGSCGVGDVTFRFYALRVNHPPQMLASWQKSCNGSLMAVDVDLSAWQGYEASFSLSVYAGASSAQDWAVWVQPVISTP